MSHGRLSSLLLQSLSLSPTWLCPLVSWYCLGYLNFFYNFVFFLSLFLSFFLFAISVFTLKCQLLSSSANTSCASSNLMGQKYPRQSWITSPMIRARSIDPCCSYWVLPLTCTVLLHGPQFHLHVHSLRHMLMVIIDCREPYITCCFVKMFVRLLGPVKFKRTWW